MAVDMFLFVQRREGDAIILVDVLAWSNGCSNTQEHVRRKVTYTTDRYGDLVKDGNGTRIEEPEWKSAPVEWTVEEVKTWADKIKGLQGLGAVLQEEQVDGKALLCAKEEDFVELLKTAKLTALGAKLRLRSALYDIKNYQESIAEDRVVFRDVSTTVWMDTAVQMTGMQALTSGEKHHRVTLVCYSGKPHRRNDEKDVLPPPGTPYIMFDMRDVICTSVSMGGSGGEDRLTLNMSLSPRLSKVSVRGINDHRGKPWIYQAALMGVDPENEEWNPEFSTARIRDRVVGVTTIFDSVSRKVDNVTWGAAVTWSLQNHRLFPEQFRQEVFQLLCVSHKKALGGLPKPVVLLIVRLLSLNYNLNPFDEFPHPCPEVVAAKLKKMADDGDDDLFAGW